MQTYFKSLTTILIFLCSPCYAKPNLPANFYQVGINQTAPQQNLDASLQQAFQDILIRCSGNTKLTQHPKFAEIISNAANYVESYHYSQETITEENYQPVMIVKYHPKSLNKALKLLEQSSLTKPKPPSLYWLIEHDNHYLMTQDSYFTQALADQAEKRMTPITLPSGDPIDHALKKTHIDKALASELMQKYKTPHVLIGHIYHLEGMHRIEWTTYQNNEPTIQGSTEEKSLALALRELVDETLYLYSRNTHIGTNKQTYHLDVTLATSYQNLQALRSELNKTNHIHNVEIQSINPKNILLTLESKYTHQQLAQALENIVAYISYDDSTQTMRLDWKYATDDASDSLRQSAQPE